MKNNYGLLFLFYNNNKLVFLFREVVTTVFISFSIWRWHILKIKMTHLEDEVDTSWRWSLHLSEVERWHTLKMKMTHFEDEDDTLWRSSFWGIFERSIANMRIYVNFTFKMCQLFEKVLEKHLCLFKLCRFGNSLSETSKSLQDVSTSKKGCRR